MNHQTIGRATIYTAKVEEWAAAYSGPPAHCILTDPPYGWSFMGSSWDHGVPSAEVWAALGKHLLPGGYLLAFGGDTTVHRLTCAIEDAGFDIRRQIGWLFLSGFPKSLNLSIAIDSAAGAEREVVGPGRWHCEGRTKAWGDGERYGTCTTDGSDGKVETAPATPEAARFDGYGTDFKPCLEWIVCAQKPLAAVTSAQLYAATGWDHWCVTSPAKEFPKGTTRQTFRALHPAAQSYAILRDKAGRELAREDLGPYAPFTTSTYAANALVHGCGGLAIDACRIGVTGGVTRHTELRGDSGNWQGNVATGEETDNGGRWPPNLILGDEASAAMLDRQSGETVSPSGHSGFRCGGGDGPSVGLSGHKDAPDGYGDSGGASRMFFQVTRQLDEADPVAYFPKAGRSEREAGLHVRSSQESGLWDSEDRSQNTPAESATPPKRAITEPAGGIQQPEPSASCSCTSKSGKKSTDPSLLDTNSTTATETSRTTASRTSNSSTPSPTSASNQVANCETESGGSLAESAASSSQSPRSTGTLTSAATQVTDGAGNATSEGSLKPSRSANGVSAKRLNLHSCVKPLSLTQYLARLVLPPAGPEPRRCLVPFAGSGSEMVGACLAGWDEVVGIEMNPEYVAIAADRLAFWQDQTQWLEPGTEPDVQAILASARKASATTLQPSLFDEL